jgi:hypothetical protein
VPQVLCAIVAVETTAAAAALQMNVQFVERILEIS